MATEAGQFCFALFTFSELYLIYVRYFLYFYLSSLL